VREDGFAVAPDLLDSERLHSELDDTPAEIETTYYRDHPQADAA
jgi:hypothetical protein